MGRKPKSVIVAEDSPAKEDLQPISPELPVEQSGQNGVSLLDDVLPPVQRDIPKMDEDLTPEQKNEFLRLLRKEIGLAERAKQLAKLARLSGNKTAAVGLRAIQTINELEGWSEPESGSAPPMFQLPEGAEVAVAMRLPEK